MSATFQRSFKLLYKVNVFCFVQQYIITGIYACPEQMINTLSTPRRPFTGLFFLFSLDDTLNDPLSPPPITLTLQRFRVAQ